VRQVGHLQELEEPSAFINLHDTTVELTFKLNLLYKIYSELY